MFSQALRFRVGIGVAFLLVGAGVWSSTPALVIAAMAPLVFITYGALTSAVPIDNRVTLTRAVTPVRTYPGDTVDVTLTVTNDGDRPLVDLRIVDGVPSELPVIDGSPRAGLNLSAGESATIAYTLRARYGEFEYDAVRCQTRSLAATSVYTTEREAVGERRVVADLDSEPDLQAERTTGLSGLLTTDRGGEGLEFFGTRTYQPNDPITRINWRQYARERELTTVEYRQQNAIEVVLVVDARKPAGVAPEATAPTGTELCIHAATEVADALIADRNRVGMAVLGTEPATTGDTLAWVPPGNDRSVRTQIRTLLDAAAATVKPGAEPADQEPVEPIELIERIPPRTQVLVVTPLADQYPIELVTQLRKAGRHVRVYTPDTVSAGSLGGTVAQTQRTHRLLELRGAGIETVEWDPSEPIEAALSRARRQTPTTSR